MSKEKEKHEPHFDAHGSAQEREHTKHPAKFTAKGIPYEWDNGKLYSVKDGVRKFKCNILKKDVEEFLNPASV